MRVVSLFLPRWPTDRRQRAAGEAPETPLVLAQRAGGRRLIHALNAAAQTAGLRPGMPVAQAQALIPDLAIADATPAADADGLGRLGLWALQRYAPLVAADPPDGLVIDTTGAAHLHGGEARMLEDMVTRLTRAGITARAAVADTHGAAHACARALADPVFVLPAGGAAALHPLPLGLLRLPPALVVALGRLGFRRIGEVAKAPRAPLAKRFGPELFRRLDQAMGRLPEPLTPLRPPELPAVARQFPEPIAAPETLARHIARLVTALCALLQEKGLGARRLDLLVQRVDGGIQALRIGTARPQREATRLTRLLCDRLETLDPGFGVEAMTLQASLTEPFETAGRDLLEPSARDVSDLIDRLANRLGPEKLYRFAPVESDVPERAVARIPAAGPAGGRWPQARRPVRLLPRPEPIETLALLPDHPPVSFSWRGIRRRVCRADGPERIFGEWWKRDTEYDAVRDYFQVEDEQGERFWIFRAGDGEHPHTGSQAWFLHGIFG